MRVYLVIYACIVGGPERLQHANSFTSVRSRLHYGGAGATGKEKKEKIVQYLVTPHVQEFFFSFFFSSPTMENISPVARGIPSDVHAGA